MRGVQGAAGELDDRPIDAGSPSTAFECYKRRQEIVYPVGVCRDVFRTGKYSPGRPGPIVEASIENRAVRLLPS
jgi:hypothetical protein